MVFQADGQLKMQRFKKEKRTKKVLFFIKFLYYISYYIYMEKKIKIGSQVFFSGIYEDYNSHDEDYIIFVKNPTLFKDFMNIRGRGKDYFYFRDMGKDEFIEYSIRHCEKLPMAAGKFLVPDVIKHLGMTIEDLKKFETFFNEIDPRHAYEKIIYDAYIKNNDFKIGKRQLNKAYKLYKENKTY